METTTKEPLYKRLNKMKQGNDWTRINGNSLMPSIAMFKIEVPKEDIGTLRINNCLNISYAGSNQNSTADYICLAVNNLHVLADVLDRIIGSMSLERVERFDLLNEAKEALNKIS